MTPRGRTAPAGGCRETLGLGGVSHVRGTSERGDEAADGPGGVGGAQGLNLAPQLDAIGPVLTPATDQVGDVLGEHLG